MTSTDIFLLQQLWLRLTGEPFSNQVLVQQFERDGGIDIQHLSHEALLSILNGDFSGNWYDVAFSFSEMLASYAAQESLNIPMNDRQVVAWTAAVFVIADVITKGETEIELQFDKVILGFLAIRGKMQLPELIYLCQRFFCSQPIEINEKFL